MPATREDLMRKLDSLGIATTTTDHPAVFTVAESDALHADMPGGHTKNLFLKDAKGRLFLFVAEAHAQIDMKKLHKHIGSARLSFGKPELLLDKLGVEPGSVTAFSVLNDQDHAVTLLVDQALMAHDIWNCHPLVNTATTAIAKEDLFAFFNATGHTPTLIDLTLPLNEG